MYFEVSIENYRQMTGIGQCALHGRLSVRRQVLSCIGPNLEKAQACYETANGFGAMTTATARSGTDSPAPPIAARRCKLVKPYDKRLYSTRPQCPALNTIII
jgi:hypothetical protein